MMKFVINIKFKILKISSQMSLSYAVWSNMTNFYWKKHKLNNKTFFFVFQPSLAKLFSFLDIMLFHF